MGLFSRHTWVIGGNAKAYELDRNDCGADCTKCNKGKCTKQWHSSMSDHMSNGPKGCGHRWS